MVKRICQYCGKPFNIAPYRLKELPNRGKYCSKSCKAKDWHKHLPEGFQEKISETIRKQWSSGERVHLSKSDPEKWKIAREKSAKAQKGKPRLYLRGRKRPPFSEEWRRKMSESKKGIVVDRTKHDEAIHLEMDRLRSEGFKVVPIGLWKFPVPDLVKVKDGIVTAVEIELGGYDGSRLEYKVKRYKEYFDGVDVVN